MPDISELILQVKNTQDSVNEIKKVTNALKETGDTAKTVGKGLFAAWSFTKVIQGARMLGDAFKDVLVTFRNFDVLYGKMNKNAESSVRTLQNAFGETEASAKKLLNLIGSRTFEFDLDPDKFGEVNGKIAEASANLAAFFQIDSKDAADKLTRSLYGMTRSLAQFGILVDQTSPSFKKQVEELKNYQGYSEKAATALTILNEVLKQTKKYEGANVEEAKTLSKAFDNISNTLKHGVFAQAGEILSKMFVPVLNKINDVLDKPWVQRIGGIIVALGGVLVAIKSITVAMGTLKAVLAGISALKIAGGIASSGIGAAIAAKLAGIGAAVVAAVAGWPVALTAAIIGVLALAGTMILNKISTGEWFNFSGMIEVIGQKINGFFESLINYLTGLSFSTDVNRRNTLFNNIMLTLSTYQESFKEINEKYDSFLKELKAGDLKKIDPKAFKIIEDIEKEYDKVLKRYNDGQILLTKSVNERNQLVNKINDLQKQLEKPLNFYKRSQIERELKVARERLDTVLADMKLQVEANKKDSKTMTSLVNKSNNVARQAFEDYQKASKERLDELSKTLDLKNWWERLNQEFTKLKFNGTPDQEKLLKSVKNRIANVKEYIDNIEKELKIELGKPKDKQDAERIKTLEDLRLSKQKEMIDMIKEETNVKLDGLKKEEDAIRATNDMIQEYAKKLLQFSPTGSEAIKSGTMEEMRFITSSLRPVGQLQDALTNADNKSLQLDQKRNDILTKAQESLNKIATSISNQKGILLRAVDYSG